MDVICTLSRRDEGVVQPVSFSPQEVSLLEYRLNLLPDAVGLLEKGSIILGGTRTDADSKPQSIKKERKRPRRLGTTRGKRD
jgi:hypothetical protein